MNDVAAIVATAFAGLVFIKAKDANAMVIKPGTRPARLTNNDVRALIASNNNLLGSPFGDGQFLNERDVLRIAYIESGLDYTAFRYEPKLGTASYGLMQILENTARDIGFNGPVENLYNPSTNIYYGMKYLVWINQYLIRKLGYSPTKNQLLSAYNAGVGNVLRGYISTAYLAKFAISSTMFA